jgi:8-oxo-dGTP pyrophosphatase MutT (NUDIX family)
MTVEPWDLLKEEYLFTHRWLKVLKRRYRIPRDDQEADFYLFEYTNWVNVLPIAEDGRMVLIRQYRPGLDEVLWEIPAGALDDDEEPLQAAKRELAEETGYEGGVWELLGTFSPNPGTHSNLSYSYLAQGVHASRPQQLDRTEDIEVVLMPPEKVRSMIDRNEFMHSLHATALLLYFFKHGL